MSENTLNIVLNGIIVKGFQGETILDLAARHGVKIPTLCHDDRLEPYTSCYLCVVEVEGMRGHQPACSTKLTEGMRIVTDNEGIRKSRKMALELILGNHYADCLGPCKQTCPAGVDVQGYISLIDKGLYSEAVALIKETNPLPAICGRVCVRPCEAACRRNLLDEGAPVGIDYLKRFAADIDLASNNRYKPAVKPSTGKKVAVIGAGPGGLSAAHFLQIEGHQVDIFEASPASGGWLRYGIPEYRLPNDILDLEVRNITELGVNIFYSKRLGENLSYAYIRDHYDATVLAIGSQIGTGVGCEGDDAGNVFSGIDFLKNMEITGQRYDFRGKTIAVVGGGNTAMDCCRTSIRCKADKVYVIYRRTEKEMPANPIEIHESKLEGVEYLFLTLPKKINKNASGEVESITCIRMELGEPDASGRRRPVPIENSDFTLQADFVLAAIGQKTDVNFIDDINRHATSGELKINKWGDIDANRETLQTGIPSVFAAGDGVTGPATIIEAIAQAKIASNSVKQFLAGLPLSSERKPFISKKDNFKKQHAESYKEMFPVQYREEMPTLEPSHRMNFSEVELGYKGEEVALHEAQRCLECGCVSFFNCDLQKYATEYGADQTAIMGEFNENPVDFRHPFIEIDTNKCILCARCIRICREVVGASALGLVNRGFKTFVAPAMGEALQDTHCESCGMCISACPTGAITENVPFKPGPVITKKDKVVCSYCSVGCMTEISSKSGFITAVNGTPGIPNPEANICRYPRFGYRFANQMQRIVQPMVKKDGHFVGISFEEAFSLISSKIREVKPNDNAFFGGARLTNEELYLIHKLARAGAQTNNVGSFHYLGRGEGYRSNGMDQVPFDQLKDASAFYLIGTDLNVDHPVLGFMVNNAKYLKKIPLISVVKNLANAMTHKVDRQVRTDSFYYFVKSVNHYILSHGLENALYLRDRTEGFEGYREMLLREDFQTLVSKAGVSAGEIASFAEQYNRENNAILIFTEKTASANTCRELFNLAKITGKLGKHASGVIAMKEKNNAQGIFDMGVSPHAGIGGQKLGDKQYQRRLGAKWQTELKAGTETECLNSLFFGGELKNVFIFGEDPVGCALKPDEISQAIGRLDFLVVQDYFMTETASYADLIMPASFPQEIGGTFTNAQRVIQEFRTGKSQCLQYNSLRQTVEILKLLAVPATADLNELFMEIASLLPLTDENRMIQIIPVKNDNDNRLFLHGVDAIVRWFDQNLNAGKVFNSQTLNFVTESHIL